MVLLQDIEHAQQDHVQVKLLAELPGAISQLSEAHEPSSFKRNARFRS